MKKRLFALFFSFSFCQAQVNPSNIQIARDTYGVPHVFGKTDAEVAYGLAWAHAEDDFKTIQLTALAGKGMLGRHAGKEGAAVDYVVGLLRTKETAKEKMHTLSPDFVTVAKAYLAGLNRYAETHPEAVLVKKSFPMTMEDYMSSIVLSLSVISGVDGVLKDIFKGEIEQHEELPKGSNAFAINAAKSTDGSTFLDINSHQPLEGPVAWYEAHLHSEEGWNMLGGLFPGGCVIFTGTNEHLGWAHTVNKQDKIDVYKLETKSPKSSLYLFDNEWLKLEQKKIKLKVKLGGMVLPIGKKAYWSKYGAAIKTKAGTYAVRLPASMELRGVEQWYRMNKAKSFSEFYKAMEMTAIPGFNTVYADNTDTIFYVSNGRIPFRNPKYDWAGILPGNTSETLWDTYHPLQDLPQYLNPPSGYVYNTNNTPFHASGEKDNLKAEDFDQTMGYETFDNNRSVRMKELLEQYQKISYEDFKTIKYDGQYPSQFHFPIDINVILKIKPEQYPGLQREIESIQHWDHKTNIENVEAALFSTFLYRVGKVYGNNNFDKKLTEAEAIEHLTFAKNFLIEHFGSTQVTLGQIQKLVRGEKELALWGLPDVITAMYTDEHRDGLRKGIAGESYIQLVRFRKGQMPEIESVVNYGASNHPESPHYADQMELFLQQKTKKMTLQKEEVLKAAERVYSPE